MPKTAIAGLIRVNPDTGLSPAMDAFLDAFPLHGSITRCAHALGIHPDTARGWAERNQVFAERLRVAKEQIADDLEDELRRRAMSGEGQMPDTLGIFLLKGYRPMFRDSYTVTTRALNVDLRIDAAQLSPDALLALAHQLQAFASEREGGTPLLPAPAAPTTTDD